MTLWTQERELTMLGQEILDYLEEEEKGMIAIGSDHGGYELKQEIISTRILAVTEKAPATTLSMDRQLRRQLRQADMTKGL